MKVLNITFLLLLINQILAFPTTIENSTETTITTTQTTTLDNSGKDDLTVEEFLLVGVEYDDDGDKNSKVKREAPKIPETSKDADRGKRALIFRPLFVYKQQEIRRQRIQEQRKTTRRPVRTRPPTYGGSQPIG